MNVPNLKQGEEDWQPREVRDEDILEEIFKLRYSVWHDEGALDIKALPPDCDGKWSDEMDAISRHWVVEAPTIETDSQFSTSLAGAARMTIFPFSDPSSRDVVVFERAGVELHYPTADLGRLVVGKAFRSRGIAQSLNRARIEAARQSGVRTVIATASEANARQLFKLGFRDTGEVVFFDDRPATPFKALILELDPSSK